MRNGVVTAVAALVGMVAACGGTTVKGNLAIEGEDVYFLEPCSQTVHEVRKDGTGGRILAHTTDAVSLVLGPGEVYWSDARIGAILHAPR